MFIELKLVFLLLNWTMWSSWRKNRLVRYCKHDNDFDYTASKPNNFDRWSDYLDLFVELRVFFIELINVIFMNANRFFDCDHTASKPNNFYRWSNYLDLFVDLKWVFFVVELNNVIGKIDLWGIASIIPIKQLQSQRA